MWVEVGGNYGWYVYLCLPDQADSLISSWNSLGPPLTKQKAINEAERALLKVDRWLAPKVGIEEKLKPRSDGLTALERVLKEDDQDFGR